MAYRNGTYIAFHAEGTSDPTASDMKYYNILRAWDAHKKIEFDVVNSHDKTAAVRDASKKETLRSRLIERLNISKNLLLIVGQATRLDTDWLPFEIEHAVDKCKIPIIAAYTDYSTIINPSAGRSLWPLALQTRIDNGSAQVIHVAFKKEPIIAAVERFNFNNLPGGSLVHFTADTYEKWGLR